MSKLGNLRSFATSKRLVAFVAAISVVFVLVRVTRAQTSRPHTSMVTDWSHRHLIFSRPTSWVTSWKLQGDIRYWQQTVRRGGFAQPVAIEMDRSANRQSENADDADDADSEARFAPDQSGREPGRIRIGGWPRRERLDEFHPDWGQSLGLGGSTGVPLSGVNWYPVFPAKFSFDVSAAPSCANDFVVFPTNLPGAAGQASIIAYNNLYAGTGASFCNAANSSVYWSYNTNFNAAGATTNGTVETSPVLSQDGSKVAFVETRTAANGGAILHLLKWKANDGTGIAASVNPTTAVSWTSCPATGACLINIVFNGGQSDTGSSPFYDYGRDALYVGDNNGVLHKFVNAFGLTGAIPAEVTAGNWPITIDTQTPGAILTSPAIDLVTGNIFIGDSVGQLSYVRETFSTSGTCKAGSTPCLGMNTIVPATHVIADAPIVDSSTGKVFVFMGNVGANAAVVQSDITLTGSVSANLGTGTGHHLHAGAFDNAYFVGNGSAGRLYMCGSSGTSAPTIQRIGFTNSGRTPASPFANPIGTMNATVDAATLTVATASAECAPVTEFFNSTTSLDQIFFGVQTAGSGTNCLGGGCVMSTNVTGIPTTLTIANSIAEANGPSGIIVDNSANTTTLAQSSSLYFSRQANATCGLITNVGCAVKVTQSGLN